MAGYGQSGRREAKVRWEAEDAVIEYLAVSTKGWFDVMRASRFEELARRDREEADHAAGTVALEVFLAAEERWVREDAEWKRVESELFRRRAEWKFRVDRLKAEMARVKAAWAAEDAASEAGGPGRLPAGREGHSA